MKLTTRFRLLCVLLLAAHASGLQAQSPSAPPRGAAVTKIVLQHVGPPAVSDDLIRANIRMKEGDRYTSQGTDGDLQNLKATGYFSNVRVWTEQETGGVKVIYQLTGRPVLTEIRFEGNRKYSNRKLLKKVTARLGEALDEYKLHTAAQEMQKMYQKAGFHRTTVEHKITVNETLGTGTATFVVHEAPKIRVIDVEFVEADALKAGKPVRPDPWYKLSWVTGGSKPPGAEYANAHAFGSGKLRRQIKTRRFWMFSWLTGSGRLKDEQFEEDKQRLKEFYQDEGYIDFEIRDVEFLAPKENRMVVRFHVFEGKQYRVGKVEFKGNEKFTSEAIRRGLSVIGRPVRPMMLEGAIFTPKGLEKDVDAIADFYGAHGYIGRRDEERIRVRAIKNANVETGTMDLVFQIEEGEPSRVERIDIQGNTKTRDRVIRRELVVSPGETFNMVRVQISKQRLQGLGFLDRVETSVDPTEDVPNAKNLVITVEEGQSGSFYMGAGFSSVENIFGYVGMTQGNFDIANPPLFTGGGQKLRVQLTLGTKQANAEVKFAEPWFLGRQLTFELDAFHRDLRYLSDLYDQTETGARVGLITPLLPQYLPGLRGGLSYTIQNLQIDFKSGSTLTNVVVRALPGGGREIVVTPPSISPELAEEEGSWLVSKPALTLVYDRRGPGQLPDRGYRVELTGQMGGGPFGGDTDFYRWDVEATYYHRGFAAGHVLELLGRVGVAEPFGDSDRTHIWDRYYLGGAYTLRGYKFRAISPRDSLTEPIGGNSSWLFSAEYSIPIIDRVRLAAFYDAGCVNADSYDFDTSNFADDVGLGLRINIPQIGPLRLDYAFPITHPDFVDGKARFQFGVGWNRPF